MKYFWPNLYSTVQDWVTTGSICEQRNRYYKPKALLQPLPPVSEPWERIGMDIVGELPPSANNDKFLLVIVDYYSRWVEAIPLKRQTSLEIARALYEHIICRWGSPEIIHTDRAQNFTRALMMELYRI